LYFSGLEGFQNNLKDYNTSWLFQHLIYSPEVSLGYNRELIFAPPCGFVNILDLSFCRHFRTLYSPSWFKMNSYYPQYVQSSLIHKTVKYQLIQHCI